MIFVSVGTDLFPFNRLIEEVDRLVVKGRISEDVLCQIGYSSYKPKRCQSVQMLPFDEMERTIQKASCMVIHAGPATIMQVLRADKIPIVVPRLKRFGEVVDDHQLYFTQKLAAEGKVIPVYEIQRLGEVIHGYYDAVKDKKVADASQKSPFQQSELFAQKLEILCQQLLEKGKK